MESLRDQLLKAGFQTPPEKEKKLDRGVWKSQVKERLLKSEDVASELRAVINETHKLFKAAEGSGDWFRRFLHPLYQLRGEIENQEFSATELRKRIKKIW
ncbi:MAG: hypothetical protein LiPW39_536 [Parcubacteria group bacterium LiPW_39]|nr:MAG: hypothetical protein LiPW39_536 [Parcubacteria group bacterium LiPW_39]